MEIYKRKADLLLKLHKNFHELILTEFDTPEDFIIEEWENKLDDNLKGKVIYKHDSSPWNKEKYIFRPSYLVHKSKEYGNFYIEYRSYSGLVAEKVLNKTIKRITNIKENKSLKEEERKTKLDSLMMNKDQFWAAKQSIFDFKLFTGERYASYDKGDATHNDLFMDLKNHSSYDNCLRIWSGENIFSKITNDDEKDALLTLSWLMFEQEINYGQFAFQQNSHFTIKNNHRSRDMIMGFVKMLFDDIALFIDYPHWEKDKNGIRLYPNFGSGYYLLENKYKKYFVEFNNTDKYGDVLSIMQVDNYLTSFKGFVNNAIQNPYFNDLKID